jgi:hypothetical protein
LPDAPVSSKIYTLSWSVSATTKTLLLGGYGFSKWPILPQRKSIQIAFPSAVAKPTQFIVAVGVVGLLFWL